MTVSRGVWFVAACLLPGIVLQVAADSVRADGYGSIRGQFVLDGAILKLKPLVAKKAAVKDAAVCSAQAVPNESLVVDPATRGIADVFIYLKKISASKIAPALKKSKRKEVVFDQKGCRFFPHALFLRTDQTIVVTSHDNCAHNTHIYPFRNQPENFVVKPNDRKGQKLKLPAREFLPTKVACDFHPWMSAHWLILDHPYAAITDKQGHFRIDRLPAGTHKFRVWQERAGWVNAGEKRGFEVTVTAGKTTDLGVIKVPVSEFSEGK